MTPTHFRWRIIGKKRKVIDEPRYRCNSVTVCIASIHSNDTIIAVSDKKITFTGLVSTEGEMTKALPTRNWISMIAGENISAAMPIVIEVVGQDTGELSVEEFSSICRKAYRHQQTIGIESTILGKYDMTLEQFKESGSKTFTDKVYEHLVEGMEEYDLGAQFLFAGFDFSCAPHLFTLTHPGKVQFFDRTGYWAVGSGRHAAISHLAAYPYRRGANLAECVYQALAAKFAAESANDVGKDTDLWIRFRDSEVRPAFGPPDDLIEFARDRYNNIERVPKDAVKAIDAELKRYELMYREEKVHPMATVTFSKMLPASEVESVMQAHAEIMKKEKKGSSKPKQLKPRKSKGQQ